MRCGDDAKITKQINSCSEAFCTVYTVLVWSVGHPCNVLENGSSYHVWLL